MSTVDDFQKSEQYKELERKRKEYAASHYQIRLSCNNCDTEKYIEAKKGTPIFWAILTNTEPCRKCGINSFRKHIFQ